MTERGERILPALLSQVQDEQCEETSVSFRQTLSGEHRHTGRLSVWRTLKGKNISRDDATEHFLWGLKSSLGDQVVKSLSDGRRYIIKLGEIVSEVRFDRVIFWLTAEIVLADIADAEIGEFVNLGAFPVPAHEGNIVFDSKKWRVHLWAAERIE